MRWLSVIAVALLQFPLSASAELVFSQDFEQGFVEIDQANKPDIGVFYVAMEDCARIKKYSSTADNKVISTVARAGKRANSQTLRYNCDYREFNEGIYQKPRQAISVPVNNIPIEVGKEHWIAFSYMLPKDWVSDYYSNRDNLFQLHHTNDGTGFKPKKNGKNVVYIVESGGQTRLNVAAQFDSAGKLKEGETVEYSWKSEVGQWQDFVIRFRPCRVDTPNCSGRLDIYHANDARREAGVHRNPIYSSRGFNTVSNIHKLELNLYKYGWVCTNGYQDDMNKCYDNATATRSKSPRTVFFDELRVGDSSSYLKEVSPHFDDCSACDAQVRPPMPPANLSVSESP